MKGTHVILALLFAVSFPASISFAQERELDPSAVGTPGRWITKVTTDKVRYAPGEKVLLEATLTPRSPAETKVHLHFVARQMDAVGGYGG